MKFLQFKQHFSTDGERFNPKRRDKTKGGRVIMNNPQYIEYLNTLGAEIDVSTQPSLGADAFLKKKTAKDEKFKSLERLFNQIIYHIRCKYYQFHNTVKHFSLDIVNKFLNDKR